MKMDRGVDTGPILSQVSVSISPGDTSHILSDRLAAAGAKLLIQTLPEYLSGKIVPVPQSEVGATYAPMLEKEAGRIDFNLPAHEIERHVRAYNPWPIAFFDFGEGILKVYRSHVDSTSAPEPGRRGILQGSPAVSTSDGWLVLDEVQPSGKKVMTGKAFLQGARDWVSR